ncbi:hypothetical protein ABZ917_17150 [Nonomuraea wenchangensis]
MGFFSAVDKLASAGAGSRMPAKGAAQVKASAANANHLNRLAVTAYPGSGAPRAKQVQAAAELERAVGKKQAKKLTEQALQRVGARPKGLRRWLG